MIYPRFIHPGDTIGITACSDGLHETPDLCCLDRGIRLWEERGYCVSETENVRQHKNARSSDAYTRWEQLVRLSENEAVSAVFMACGGDFLVEMLSFADFSALLKHPKWYQGYSDPTGLLYLITVCCDMATIYGGNFSQFGMIPLHESVETNISVLEGKPCIQKSFPLYQDGFTKKLTGTEPYVLTEPVKWRLLREKTPDSETLCGRMLGGCMDVLLNLIGTRFDRTQSFIEKYKEDGILWYLETFSLTNEEILRGLWQMKEAGWFAHAKGIVFGRPTFVNTFVDITYDQAISDAVGALGIPILLDTDIGHKPPRLTVINGAIAKICYENNKGSMEFVMK